LVGVVLFLELSNYSSEMLKKVVLALVFALLAAQPSFSAVKAGDKCSKVGAITKSKKATYTCVKIGKKSVWGIVKRPTPTPTPTQTNDENLIISPVPSGNANTTFMLGKPQSRDIGQTLYFDSPVDLTRLEFQIAMLTLITPEYHAATEEQKHNLERSAFRGEYKPIDAKINVSLWRDDRNVLGALPNTFDLRTGFSRIEEFDVTATISVAETTSINFPRSIQVTPGYYYLNLFFVVDDLNVTTLRFQGRQSGTNTMGGPNRDLPTNCKYTPATDLYPQGQAYYSYQDTGWDKKSPTEKWNYQTPRSYTFKLHDYAKVSECAVIGNYNDILNTGDIFFNLYGKER
jgi:hypothetical protein